MTFKSGSLWIGIMRGNVDSFQFFLQNTTKTLSPFSWFYRCFGGFWRPSERALLSLDLTRKLIVFSLSALYLPMS